MSKIMIRLSKSNEYQELAEIFMKSFLGETKESTKFERIAQNFNRIIEKKLTAFYVAEIDGELIGFGGETRYEGSSYIGYIGIIPHHRKKGYGTLIFKKILDDSKIHNPTVDLFANLGPDKIYRRFGFVDEYLAHMYQISINSNFNPNLIKENNDLPEWILNLDSEIMGFNRSKLLNYLFEQENSSLISYKKNGFAFCLGTDIGPVIAENENIGKKLINYFLLKGANKIIVPEYNKSVLSIFVVKNIATCLKMTFGEKLNCKSECIYGFRAFATS